MVVTEALDPGGCVTAKLLDCRERGLEGLAEDDKRLSALCFKGKFGTGRDARLGGSCETGTASASEATSLSVVMVAIFLNFLCKYLPSFSSHRCSTGSIMGVFISGMVEGGDFGGCEGGGGVAEGVGVRDRYRLLVPIPFELFVSGTVGLDGDEAIGRVPTVFFPDWDLRLLGDAGVKWELAALLFPLACPQRINSNGTVCLIHGQFSTLNVTR